MSRTQCIALIAHDQKKDDMAEFARRHRSKLLHWRIVATGTTGGRIKDAVPELDVTRLKSGPLGGDQQIGAMIAEQKIDWLVFFWDPLSSQPHDPDVKALIRLAVVWNIPVACNQATADFIIHSSLYQQDYKRDVPDFSVYQRRLDKD